MERLRQTHSKEIESKDDEVEEIRQSCSKKVNGVAASLCPVCKHCVFPACCFHLRGSPQGEVELEDSAQCSAGSDTLWLFAASRPSLSFRLILRRVYSAEGLTLNMQWQGSKETLHYVKNGHVFSSRITSIVALKVIAVTADHRCHRIILHLISYIL